MDVQPRRVGCPRLSVAGPGTPLPDRHLPTETLEGFTVAQDLTGRTIAFLVATEGVEQIELTEPWNAITDAGATAHLISTESGEIQAFNHLDKADTFPVDRTVDQVSADVYDGLVQPGGVANPDFLRL